MLMAPLLLVIDVAISSRLPPVMIAFARDGVSGLSFDELGIREGRGNAARGYACSLKAEGGRYLWPPAGRRRSWHLSSALHLIRHGTHKLESTRHPGNVKGDVGIGDIPDE